MSKYRVYLSLAAILFALVSLVGGVALPANDERVVSLVEISATDEPPPVNVATVSASEPGAKHSRTRENDGGDDNAPTHVARLRRRAFVRGSFFSRFISMHSADASSYYVDSWAAFLVAIG